mmetsp:Transcript_27018/g.40731  ORF Transcript_27018/g.40731 Transcript_27018/m.40731 type:complete len:221 (-) Transcript_27018:250-912(-)
MHRHVVSLVCGVFTGGGGVLRWECSPRRTASDVESVTFHALDAAARSRLLGDPATHWRYQVQVSLSRFNSQYVDEVFQPFFVNNLVKRSQMSLRVETCPYQAHVCGHEHGLASPDHRSIDGARRDHSIHTLADNANIGVILRVQRKLCSNETGGNLRPLQTVVPPFPQNCHKFGKSIPMYATEKLLFHDRSAPKFHTTFQSFINPLLPTGQLTGSRIRDE